MRVVAIMVSALVFGLSYAVAQDAPELPPNTIDCAGFTKATDGNWRVGAPTTFDFGTAKGITLSGITVNPRSVPLGGGDLYDALENKCAGWS